MSIIYNNQVVAGKYKEQIVNEADTLNKGIVKIATQEEVNTGTDNTTAVTPLHLSEKQDKLIAGDGIVIDENLIECTVYPDEQTIIQSDDGTIVSVGQWTKSNTIKFDWEGTEAEYEQAMKDGIIQPDWYCYITDDEVFTDYGDVVDQSLSNLKQAGIEKLNVSKMFYTGDICTEPIGYNQLLQMKDSSFDLSKFTVVGSPTITIDGIASDFNNGYFSINTKLGETFKLTIEFETGEPDPSIAQTVMWLGDDEHRLRIQFNKTGGIEAELQNHAVGFLNCGEFTERANTKNIFIFEVTDSQIISTNNGIVKTIYKSDIDSELLWSGSTIGRIGNIVNIVDYDTIKNINLKSISIISDDKEVFNTAKTGIDIVDDIEIPYIEAKTGSKIVDVQYRDRVKQVYDINGVAGYFTIDEVNKNYTLPMGELYGVLANLYDNRVSLDGDNFNEAGKENIREIVGSDWCMFDTKLSDHVLEGDDAHGWELQGTYVYREAVVGEHLGYPDFYDTCVKEYNEAIENGGIKQITLSGTVIDMYIHPNGHMYYNVLTHKELVDSWFNIFGTAWYYGIDTENKRILLPRSNWFEQLTASVSNVGRSVDAGLPNITGQYSASELTERARTVYATGALYDAGAHPSCNYNAGGDNNGAPGMIGLDASLSSAVYGKSSTVQPYSVKKLLYICVGNVRAKTSWINIVEQVKNGVKEIDDTRLSVLSDIDSRRESSLGEIDEAREFSLDEIEELKDLSLLEMEEKRVDSNESILSTKDNYIAEITQTATDKMNEAKYWAELAELSSSNALFDIKKSDHILNGPEERGWGLEGTYVYKEAIAGERLGYSDFYNRCLEEYKNSTNILESKTVTKTWKSPSGFNGVSFSGNIVVNENVTIGHGETFSGEVTGTFSIKINFDRPVELSGINIGGDLLEDSSRNWGVYITYAPDDGDGKILHQGSQGMSASATLWNINRTWETVTTQNVTIMISSSSSTPLALLLHYIKVTATYEDVESVVQHQNGHVFYNVLIQDVVDNIFASTGTAWMYGIDTENECIYLPRGNHGEIVEDYKSGTSWYRLYSDGWLEQGGICNSQQYNTVKQQVTFLKTYKDTNYTALTCAGPTTQESWQIATRIAVKTTTGLDIRGGSNANVAYTGATTWYTQGYADIPNSQQSYTYICVGNTKADTAWINVVEQVEAGVKDIYDTKEGVLNAIDDLRETSLIEVGDLCETSLNEMENVRQTSLTEMENKRVQSNESIISTKDQCVSNVIETSEDLIEEAKSWAIGTQEERSEGSAKYWAEVAELSSSNALFDTKVSDHVLKDSEAYGWGLQGTYVYKNAVFGEHLGYPDFYNKCLEEYNEAIATETFNGVTVKVHSNGHNFYNIADKTGIDDFFNTMGSAWMYGVDEENERIFLPRNNFFDQMTDNVAEVGGSIQAGLPNITGTFMINTGTEGGVTGTGPFYDTGRTGGNYSTGHAGGAGNPVVGFNASHSSSVYKNDVDTVQPNAVKKLLYICVGNTKADTSWMKLAEQVEAGIKDIEDVRVSSLSDIENARVNSITDIDDNRATSMSQIDENRVNSLSDIETARVTSLEDIETNRVNSMTDIDNNRTNSMTQIDENRESSLAQIDALRNGSVKDVNIARNDSLNALANATNTLRETQITNCIKEIPQRIKLELNNGVLTLKAGSEVIVPNGFEEDGTTLKFDEVTIENDVKFTYADGYQYVAYVHNKNGVWYAGVNSITTSFSGEVDSGTDWRLWYNTKQNIINRYNSTGITENQCSFPVCIYNSDSTQITSIIQTFTGMGYIGSTVWVDKGVKGLIPNGRNEDGSLKNIEAHTERVLTYTNKTGVSEGRYYSFTTPVNGVWTGIDFKTIYALNASTPTSLWYFSEAENKWFYDGKENPWLDFAHSTDAVASPYIITSFQPKQPFRAVDYNEFANTPHIIETYVNGTSGYNLYSNGYCEQWGYSSATNTRTITLLKSYNNTSYIPVAVHAYGSNRNINARVTAVTATTFSVYCEDKIFWHTKGYIT